MESSLTDYQSPLIPIFLKAKSQHCATDTRVNLNKSDFLLDKIYATLNSSNNHRDFVPHKMSIFMEETHQTLSSKCKCKKSKCLKLYCECFSNGSFCKDCSCENCQNTQQFGQIRAKAIDQVIIKTSVPFGHRSSSIKGCNCKKTDCTKKYCECFGSGDKCSQYCKCLNCLNN